MISSMRFSSLLILFSAAAAMAVDPTSGKKLTFSDDFNGDALDDSKWVVEGKKEAISIVKGGKDKVLRISLVQSADMIQGNGISTKGKFEQLFGYFEASMRMNAYKGHTGYLRLGPADGKAIPNTLVLFEGLGGDSLHPWMRTVNDNGQHDYRPEGKMTQFLKAGEASKKFNTYGLLCSEKSYIWYVNGKQVHKVDRVEMKLPVNITFSHRVAEFERPSLNLKQLPDDVDIDWVKVWK